jgi:hypothetical protein
MKRFKTHAMNDCQFSIGNDEFACAAIQISKSKTVVGECTQRAGITAPLYNSYFAPFEERPKFSVQRLGSELMMNHEL